ncbi:ABC-three component system middle component 6 [Clostridium perfringens]|uniref:ABC-three component system middle component 6 n=1 Tax=Clostridium perfringens TaxID=1502 RepID=UPI003C6C239F
MLVNFDDDPRNSLLYTVSIILEYLKCKSNSRNFDDLFKYCMDNKMEYSLFFLSIDWLYLVRVIKEINKRNEVILCD